MRSFDVRVSGAGIVGTCLALALARLGLAVALRPARASADAGDDVRAYALNAASVCLLRELKVWDALPAHAATPVHEMLVHGDAAGAAIEFSSWQQRTAELAFITDAAALERELAAAAGFAPHLTIVDDEAPATLVAHCEGRAAAARKDLASGFSARPYGQQAIAARLVSSRRHANVARQWFRSPDVLALLPFGRPEPERSYGLVWSLPSERASELMAADAARFEHELALATGGEAGRSASPRSGRRGR